MPFYLLTPLYLFFQRAISAPFSRLRTVHILLGQNLSWLLSLVKERGTTACSGGKVRVSEIL